MVKNLNSTLLYCTVLYCTELPHPGAPGGLAAGVGVAAPLLAGEGEVTVSVGRVEVPPHLLSPAHSRPNNR